MASKCETISEQHNEIMFKKVFVSSFKTVLDLPAGTD
jgi:hypothetical protein